MSAMPLMIGVLCVMAIMYRLYSAFLAAKVACLDDTRDTPAVRRNDGQNYHPTSRWVLFGHHFAAISGAGPLIGPVLAAQFGYLPGLLWILIGVCLAGAVQDFLVLSMSIRREGRSLAQIAMGDIGKVAGVAATAAILFIIIIALAGLGKVVVKALGGEKVKFPPGSVLVADSTSSYSVKPISGDIYEVAPGARIEWNNGQSSMLISEGFLISSEKSLEMKSDNKFDRYTLHTGAARLVPGSAWGTFTIACTIPIALLVGLWMYKIRPGHVTEASIIGAVLTLGATVAGGYVADQPWGSYFSLSDTHVTWSMAAYGFIASVLPVWVLLCPRDYLSSFLKIGTIGLLVGGVIIANPALHAPAFNTVFKDGGPTIPGKIFPFLFITIMCGAISGFHALVSSGTTPKMIKKESDARVIGYGAMLIEGLVGVTAMIAAAALPVRDYYGMNTDLAVAPKFHDRILEVAGAGGVEHIGQYEQLTRESLRGRTGGAVTLAVGMATIFDQAAERFFGSIKWLWKYWYHFAIMFEALFILTTIDTGTRIGRFLLQEVFSIFSKRLGHTSSLVGSVLSTAMIVAAWSYFISANEMAAIWPMFGVANQMLAVIALAVVSVYLANEGRARYLWVTLVPMFAVLTTTSSAASQMLLSQINTIRTQTGNAPGVRDQAVLTNAIICAALIAAMIVCAYTVLLAGAIRIWKRLKAAPAQSEPVVS